MTLLSPAVREATSECMPVNKRKIRLTLVQALEVYFSRSLGFTLLALGVLNLLLTGSIPLTSRLTDGM